MKKVIVLFLCFFYLNGVAQSSTIQIKDLAVIYQNDTTRIDTINIVPTTYLLLAKIDSIANAKKVYFKFGTANDLEDAFSLIGTVQEVASPDGSSTSYSILYNGRSFSFKNFTTSIFLPIQSVGNLTPLIVTFYVEDKQGRFSSKLYYTIKG